jgi:ring-1,2-phenylacetyl-CoA epoxidase subunit PaaD
MRDSDIVAAIDAVADPEMPITLRDLGVLRLVRVSNDEVTVVLRPTRLSCPGRNRMASDIENAVRRVDSEARVLVEWELEPWGNEDVTEPGRVRLEDSGYALNLSSVRRCPYCGSSDTRAAGGFSGSVCKMAYSCLACGSPFELLRSSGRAT